MQYRIKTLAFKAKNSPYTIIPGVYEASTETQETWDYLLKIGAAIIEKEVVQEIKPEPKLSLKVEVEKEPVSKPATTTSKKTLKNQIQGDN